MSERVEGAIPPPPITDATEFVFVNGYSFLNAAKHEAVVYRHVTRAERAEHHFAQCKEALKQAKQDMAEIHGAAGSIRPSLTIGAMERIDAALARAEKMHP